MDVGMKPNDANRIATPAAATVRKRLAALLEEGPLDALEISAALSVREREVAGHLEHLRRTLAASGAKLVVIPASCIECGYAFAKREKLGKPSRCPVCKSERIDPPRFGVEGAKAQS